MLENVCVSSVPVSDLGGFTGSVLRNVQQEYILSHIVWLSQEKGEWITEFSFEEFLKDFRFHFFHERPLNGSETVLDNFAFYFRKLLEAGYFETNDATQTFKVTEKFAQLCENHAVA